MKLDRRTFIVGSGAAAAAAALGAGALQRAASLSHTAAPGAHYDHGGSMTVGELRTDDFDPSRFASEFLWGDRVATLDGGRSLRDYTLVAVDKDIEVAPGIEFPAWTYNGQVPGPTLRAYEGDRLRIRFRNDGSHPHTIHFHGFHPPEMDGIPGVGRGNIAPGEEIVYEFDADPYGTHLYHCHTPQLKKHIAKGLYGAFIIDPPGGYDVLLGKADREYVMVMNAFDTNFDGGNEVYAVNTKAFAYAAQPLPARVGEMLRIFLVNLTEFDPVNSMHTHGNFFDYYDTGRLENKLTMVDTVQQIQGQRGILQLRPRFPGKVMFHAHQSEFAELGWMGFFEVLP